MMLLDCHDVAVIGGCESLQYICKVKTKKWRHLCWGVIKSIIFKNKKMDELFLSEDVLTSEMDELLGGIKITVRFPNGVEIEVEI